MTEWLPLSVVYMTHFCDFYRNMKNEKATSKEMISSVEKKRFEMLMANSPEKDKKRGTPLVQSRDLSLIVTESDDFDKGNFQQLF